MINLFWSGLLMVLLVSGCGWNGTPTRGPEGIVPLTSIEIVPESSATLASATIGTGTSTKLKAYGNYGSVRIEITNQTGLVWSSDTPSIANFITTSTPNRVSGVSAGTATITATVAGVTGSYTLAVSDAVPSTVAVAPAAPPALPKGRNTQFTATGTFPASGAFSAFTQDLTFDATWTSSNLLVATVSKGVAIAVAASGTADITASFGGVSSAPVTLNAAPAVLESIAVSPANPSVVGQNKTVNFTATGTYSDATTTDITTTCTWNSSQTGIATIVATSGVATTVAAGSTVISATLGGVSGSTNLTVTTLALKANGLQITPLSKTLSAGTTQQMQVMATFIDNSTQDVTSSCSWSSSTTAASVTNPGGLVTAGLVAGSTTITATYGGQSVSAVITVQ